MIQLFQQHQIRRTQDLSGIWDFKVKDKPEKYQITVPGCWEQVPALSTYRGQGIYSRTIVISELTNLRLVFKGISHTAEVYFDNQFIGRHYGAYTSFDLIVPQVKAGQHQLKIVVDNRFSEQSALHVPNDYYTYGGLTRGVVLEYLSDTYLQALTFTSHLQADQQWQAELTATIVNLAAQTKSLTLAWTLADQRYQQTVTLAANSQQKFTWSADFPEVTAWSPQTPQLYFLQAELIQSAQKLDDLIERVGFREVTMKQTQLLLNGRPIFLKGFNRHEDYPGVGCSLPLALMNRDLDLLEDLGANAVRTCHYPNDELFLDLCDQRGFLVWEENHARGLSLAQMENPNFDRQSAACIQEFIPAHYNHPSIIIWGLLNECASQTAIGRKKYQKQFKQIRQLDQSRPVTAATRQHFTDLCLDLDDIVSVNMYSGWYDDHPVAAQLDQEYAWIQHAGGDNKPLIISEFGAGGIYGDHDYFAKSKWSEERQVEIIAANLETYLHDERITGVFLWQFADCRVTEQEWFATRPRTYNNKGVVDEYRRPKLAYSTVKKYYHEK